MCLSLPFRVFEWRPLFVILQQSIETKIYFDGRYTRLSRDSKSSFVYSSIFLAEDVNMPFFPRLPAVFIIPREYFHKCKPPGKPGLEQTMKATSFGFFCALGWVRPRPLAPDSFFSSFPVAGKGLHTVIYPKDLHYHFYSICSGGPAAGHFLSCFI